MKITYIKSLALGSQITIKRFCFCLIKITSQTVCLNSKLAFDISSTCLSNKQVVRVLNYRGKLREFETSTYGKYSLRQASLSVADNKRGGARIKLRTGFVA